MECEVPPISYIIKKGSMWGPESEVRRLTNLEIYNYKQKSKKEMLLRQQSKSISGVLGQARECFSFHKTAKLWFSPLLSISEYIEYSKLGWDITKQEYNELLKILNHVVADIIAFYRTPPDDVYKLLCIIKIIFGIGETEPVFSGYSVTISQVHFNSNLALFFLKNKQYASVHDSYEFIVDIVRQDKLDTAAEIFLVAISNYLSFLKTHQFAQVKSKLLELVALLNNIYRNLLDKYTVTGCQQSNLLALLAVYKQHELHLNKYKGETKLLIKKYEETHHTKQKERDHALQTINDNFKLDLFLQKNKANKVTEIEIKKKQLYFFTSTLLFLNKRSQNKQMKEKTTDRYSIEIEKNKKGQSSMLHRNSQVDDKQLLAIKAENKQGTNAEGRQDRDRLSEIKEKLKQKKGSYKTIQTNIKEMETFNQKNADKKPSEGLSLSKPSLGLQLYQSVQLAAQKSTLQQGMQGRQSKQLSRLDYDQYLGRDETLVLKANFCIVTIIKDGIILSDFLQMRKTFITWQEVMIIMRNLRFCYIFTEALPICSFYDIGRILSNYLYKADNNDPHGVLLLERPKELVELNMLSKLYFVEPKYLKLFVMNQYDTDHIEIAIDCYFEEFQQLFKVLTKNQYIQYLNSRLFNQGGRSREKIYSVEAWKKKKQTAALELSNQIKMQQLEQIPYIKSTQFKILVILPKNVQLVLYLREKDFKDEENNLYLPLTIISLENRNEYRLKVPMYKFNRYFPLMSQTDIPSWLKKFGRFVFEAYLKCFYDFPTFFNNMQFFNIVTYANKVEMIAAGKYYSPITAELVGSQTRIWGICIHYFEQANIQEKATFIYNPYYDLMAPVIGQSLEERKKFLVSQLHERSVQETYKLLVRNKVEGTMINIRTYWNLIGF